MTFNDLNDFFAQVRTGKVPTLEQWNYLEEKTDQYDNTKLDFLINDLKVFREGEKRKLLGEYKKAKKTRTFKRIVRKGDNVPFIDFYEGFKAKGIEDQLPEDFYAIEGEKYLALFFPKELKDLDHLMIQLQQISRTEKNSDSVDTPQFQSNLNWEGSHIEFAEIVKALIEAKKISGENDKLIFEDLCKIFGIEEFKKDSRLKGLKKRINETTPLLIQLEESLNNWIDKNKLL